MNKIYVYIILVCLGFAICYFTMPSRVITQTVKVKELVYIKAKTHSVSTTKDGVTTVVTDTISDTTSSKYLDGYTKTEINKKKMMLLGSYLLGKDNRAFQVSILTNVTNSVIIGTGIQYNTTNRYAMGMITAGVSF